MAAPFQTQKVQKSLNRLQDLLAMVKKGKHKMRLSGGLPSPITYECLLPLAAINAEIDDVVICRLSDRRPFADMLFKIMVLPSLLPYIEQLLLGLEVSLLGPI